MLRNVSASSTYQIGGGGSGSVGTPKSSVLAKTHLYASSPLLSKRARESSVALPTQSSSCNELSVEAMEIELPAQMERTMLASCKTAVGK